MTLAADRPFIIETKLVMDKLNFIENTSGIKQFVSFLPFPTLSFTAYFFPFSSRSFILLWSFSPLSSAAYLPLDCAFRHLSAHFPSDCAFLLLYAYFPPWLCISTSLCLLPSLIVRSYFSLLASLLDCAFLLLSACFPPWLCIPTSLCLLPSLIVRSYFSLRTSLLDCAFLLLILFFHSIFPLW